MYQCSYLLAFDELGKVALLIHVEDDDRHVALAAERESCLVHHLEAVLDRLVECEFVLLHSSRVLLRIGCIDSVDSRSLEKSIRTDLERPEGRA